MTDTAILNFNKHIVWARLAALTVAIKRLAELAAKVTDDAYREAFLIGVPAHRAVRAIAEALA